MRSYFGPTESSDQPTICDFHKKAIFENFGQSMLNDAQHILSFSWLKSENVVKNLKELYDYQFLDSTITQSIKQNKGFKVIKLTRKALV